MKRVLVVDESEDTRVILYTFLRDLFQVETCTLREFSKTLAGKSIRKSQILDCDLVILSVEKLFALKPMLETWKTHRAGSPATVLAIVPDQNPRTLEFLFESGVDQYLAQPFEFHHLYWCVRFLLRSRTEQVPETSATQTLGPYTLYRDRNEVETPHGKIHVTSTQMKLLETFAQYANRLLSRDVLKQIVWSGEHLSARSIDAHISKLKRLLPLLENYLESIYGKGYLWRTQPMMPQKTTASKRTGTSRE